MAIVNLRCAACDVGCSANNRFMHAWKVGAQRLLVMEERRFESCQLIGNSDLWWLSQHRPIHMMRCRTWARVSGLLVKNPDVTLVLLIVLGVFFLALVTLPLWAGHGLSG
jgi:hypothetical protein